MTLKEAVEYLQQQHDAESAHRNENDLGPSGYLVALKIVVDTARQHIDDTAEIPLPCSTCRGRKEIVCKWHDGTAAVSPCPTCVGKPTEVKP